MADKKKFSLRLNAFLMTESLPNLEAYLSVPLHEVVRHELNTNHAIDGLIFVKKKPDKPARAQWAKDLDGFAGKSLDGLEVASSSALMFVRAKGRVIVFSFGYGRFLLSDEHIVLDFGIRTALNTLNHDTLRSVDLFSLEHEPIQKRSQATKKANINNFGVDVSRDVLKAVTGEPIKDVAWKTISGGGPQYSFTSKVFDYIEVLKIAENLVDYYQTESYKDRFAWVDNIQRITQTHLTEKLDKILIEKMKERSEAGLALTLPGAEDWGEIYGFSYTNAKKTMYSAPSILDYYVATDVSDLTIEKIKEHKLFCHKINGDTLEYSIYEASYFECNHEGKLYILFSRQWFSIDLEYSKRIQNALMSVPISTINFPEVQQKWVKGSKPKKDVKSKASDSKSKIGTGAKAEEKKHLILETEGEYNIRTAMKLNMCLMDKKLVSSVSSASPIEVCDLLSADGKFIHVKHRKGYSSGLSHLFAQGRVAAELLLTDQDFRKNAREKLDAKTRHLISDAKFDVTNAEIIFLILGANSNTLVNDLPFFSKVNLYSTFVSLNARNFKVSVCGASLEPV